MRRSFHKLVCPFFFPLLLCTDWLSMKRVIAWLWKKKERKREREKKEERTVQACFIFHACFAIRNLCGHAFRLFSLHTLITHRFSTLYYSSISISIYRADCVSAEEIVAGICTALNISGECECVCVREREQFGPLFISMVSSSIRIAYKSKSNPISKIIIRLMAKKFWKYLDIKINRISNYGRASVFFDKHLQKAIYQVLQSWCFIYVLSSISKQRLIQLKLDFLKLTTFLTNNDK